MSTYQPVLKSKAQPGNATVSYASNHALNTRENGEPLRLLTEEQWAFWRHNGYIVLKDAVPQHQVTATAALLWEFEEKDPNDPTTWYAPPRREIEMKELIGSGMVEIYQHQLLWDNRQYPRVYEAFVDVWGDEKLWVTIDRANLNFPVRPQDSFKGFIHWDIDTSLNPRPYNVQGVLALSETTDLTGGFQCIPELYRTFDEWVKGQPADRDPFQPDYTGFGLTQVNMQPGDLLIFNAMLPHGIRPNRSDKPRLAQYISMLPAQNEHHELREWRIQSWRNKMAPEGYAFPGDPRDWEKLHTKTAELTPLGKKLLGLDLW
ncbi:MAG: phytanoyl-CoA dioxygenase family protein [Cyclobacteriaceae bacterium]|nr:phytanoyl-CoA dioxygenase family protein [Cyclobacteriaceae bacterium]